MLVIASLRSSLAAMTERFTVPIVCICGSTRFKQAWIAENARLTGEGNIVLAVGLWGHHERVFPDAETKKRLDELHLRKIDLCDWVWVLDVGGYIGESTRNEIAYAEAHGKPVRYLSKEIPNYVEPTDPLSAVTRERDEARAAVDFLSRNSVEIVPRKNGSVELYMDRCTASDEDSNHVIAPTLLDAVAHIRRRAGGEW